MKTFLLFAALGISTTVFYLAGHSDGMAKAKKESVKEFTLTLLDIDLKPVFKSNMKIPNLKSGYTGMFNNPSNIDAGIVIKGFVLSAD